MASESEIQWSYDSRSFPKVRAMKQYLILCPTLTNAGIRDCLEADGYDISKTKSDGVLSAQTRRKLGIGPLK